MDCPICFESIKKKFTFNCQHSVCKSCRRNMSKKGQIMIYDISMVHYPIIQEFEINKAGILKFYEGAIQLHSIKDIFYSDLIKLYTCYSYYVEQVEANNKRMEELIKTRQNGR